MNTTETTQRAQETAVKAQELAAQVKDQTKTMVDDARSSDLASTATDVAHQVADKARDLASGLATEVAVRTGRKKPGRLSRLGASIRNHPVHFLLGTAAVGAVVANVMRKRSHAAGPAATSNAPEYGESTPGARTQPGPVTDMQTESVTAPSEPANR